MDVEILILSADYPQLLKSIPSEPEVGQNTASYAPLAARESAFPSAASGGGGGGGSW